MKKYPAYKDSGIEWIGEIPEHWSIKSLKRLAECLDGKRIPLNAEQRGTMQGEVPYWGANGILDHLNDYLFDEELVLLGEDGAPFFDRNKPVAFFVNGKVWVNNHAHILRAFKGVNPKFLTNVLNCVDYRPFINGSTRDKLTQGEMNDIPIQSPPSDEQQAIADFLDKKTALIDGLIEKKKRQIELLKEQRQAVINQAITKGLDPTVEMKDSGIEWIGKIPKHWKPIRFKYLFSEIYRYPTYYGIEYEPDGILEIRGLMLKVGAIIDYENEPRFISKKTSDKYPRTQLKTGDIVMSVRGTIGKIGLVPKEIEGSNITANLMRLSPICEIANSEYLSILLETYYFQNILEVASDQTTIKTITVPDLVCSFLSIPPLTEQKDIVLYLKEQINETDKLIKKAEKQIELLQEYRTALISEAVTGKIDVRNAV